MLQLSLILGPIRGHLSHEHPSVWHHTLCYIGPSGDGEAHDVGRDLLPPEEASHWDSWSKLGTPQIPINIVFLHQNIDDWLVIWQSSVDTADTMRRTYDLMTHLGFIINHQKFWPTTSQTQTCLGAVLNLQLGKASPTEERIVNLHLCIIILLSSQLAPAKA